MNVYCGNEKQCISYLIKCESCGNNYAKDCYITKDEKYKKELEHELKRIEERSQWRWGAGCS